MPNPKPSVLNPKPPADLAERASGHPVGRLHLLKRQTSEHIREQQKGVTLAFTERRNAKFTLIIVSTATFYANTQILIRYVHTQSSTKVHNIYGLVMYTFISSPMCDIHV